MRDINKLYKSIESATLEKLGSLSSQINMLKKMFADSNGQIATHATSRPALKSIIESGKIDTPMRLVAKNPDIKFEDIMHGYARTSANPEYIDSLAKYKALPQHLRGEARKGYFNYLDNKDTPIMQKLKEVFGDDLPYAMDESMMYEAGLKPESWLKKKRFKELFRRYEGKRDAMFNNAKLDTDRGEATRDLLSYLNMDRNSPVTPSQMRAGRKPPDAVSFSDKVHRDTRFGNNIIVAPKKNIRIGDEGPMSYSNPIHEYEHIGPYRLKPSDLVLTEGNGDTNLAGLGRRTISPKAWDIFSKKYLGGSDV